MDQTKIEVTLAQHTTQILQNTKAIGRLEARDETIGNLRVDMAELKTKVSQLQWLMGMVLLSVLALAFAVLRMGIL